MTCINTETKESLLLQIDELLPESSRKVKLADFINKLEKCTTDDTQLGKKKKRPLSSYNVFLGQCMGKSKLSMKECIPKWRIIKECIKNNGSLESCKAEQGY